MSRYEMAEIKADFNTKFSSYWALNTSFRKQHKKPLTFMSRVSCVLLNVWILKLIIIHLIKHAKATSI
jgi:hypothetical protein